MKKNLLIMPLLIWVCTMQAQQIVTSGGYTMENEFSADWIIGGSLVDNSVFTIDEEIAGFEFEKANIDLINVHPTVTRDFLNIITKYDSETKLNYKIKNISGADFMNGNFNVNSSFELDVKDLISGYYLIIFSSTNDKTFIVSKKFIKL